MSCREWWAVGQYGAELRKQILGLVCWMRPMLGTFNKSSHSRFFTKRQKHFLLLPVFFLVAALNAETRANDPQSLVSVEGTIVDAAAHAVADARIEIRSLSSNQVLMDTRSDADGKFLLVQLALPAAKYTVKASHPDYRSAEQEIQVVTGVSQIGPLTFILKPPLRVRGPQGPKQKFTVVPIFFATDRAESNESGKVTYLNVRAPAGKLSLGMCNVSIPERHQLAELERPSLWKLEFHENAENHIVVQQVIPQSAGTFFESLSQRVKNSEHKDAFVFVHGFDTSFTDAAERTAQLAYDLGFQGAPILYSWPSEARLFGYRDDEKTIQKTVENLKKFLIAIAHRSAAVRIHLVAHSMGNRALLLAFAQLQQEISREDLGQFQEIILAAPDVDRESFTKIAKQISNPANRLTLYVSGSDQALLISHKLFHTQPRAGESGSAPIILPGLDTIDVTAVSTDTLGHSYYGDNRAVISDLLQVFEHEKPPRSGLSRAGVGSLGYWLLRPTN